MACAFLEFWFNLSSLIDDIVQVGDEEEVIGCIFALLGYFEVHLILLIDVLFRRLHGGINHGVVLENVVVGAVA